MIKKLPGRPSRYRGKMADRPVVMTFTPEGHAALAEGTRVERLSRSDYVEKLLRDAQRKLSRRGTYFPVDLR